MDFSAFSREWDWIHPSHRDLVIEQLSRDTERASLYIEKGGMPAIALALSIGGGDQGNREFPLLRSPKSWSILTRTCLAMIEGDPVENPSKLFTIFEGIVEQHHPNVTELIHTLCRASLECWERKQISLSANLVQRFISLSEKSGIYIPTPRLEISWNSTIDNMRRAVATMRSEPAFSAIDEIDSWLAMFNLVSKSEPRLLRGLKFEEAFDLDLTNILGALEKKLETHISSGTTQEFEEEAEFVRDCADLSQRLQNFFKGRKQELVQIASKFEEDAEDLEEQLEEMKNKENDDYEPDYESERSPSRSADTFSVDKLFNDL